MEKFKKNDSPIVSIIIAVSKHENSGLATNCLESVVGNLDGIDLDIILVNWTTEKKEWCNPINGMSIEVTHQIQSLNIIDGMNKAFTVAKGKYIVLLDGKCIVQPGWLTSLIGLLENELDIGIAGPKVIYPDGVLQNAGGIVWQNGESSLYGRMDEPEKEEYMYVREVDYVPGSAIMIRSALLEEIGVFDNSYRKSEYCFLDIAFRARAMGKRVVFQPFSRVLYRGRSSIDEFNISNNMETSLFDKKLFVNKHKDYLVKQLPANENVYWARSRSFGKKTIIVLDGNMPMWDTNAGNRTTYQYMRLFLELGMHVIFVSATFKAYEPYISYYRQMGIEVLAGPQWNKDIFDIWIDQNGSYIDYVYLQRLEPSIAFFDSFKEKTNAKIFFYPMDIQSVREERQYTIEKDYFLLKRAKESRRIEDILFKEVDVIHVISTVEENMLSNRYPEKIVRTIPCFIYDESYFLNRKKPSLINRDGIIFVGGFNHAPNKDAVLWFMSNIYPLIIKEYPHCPVKIVGSNPDSEILQLASDDIKVTGYVSDAELESLYEHSRVVVVPLRYGAGVKGKVVEAITYQIPVVTTSIGSEGLPGVDKEIDIADSEDNFAAMVCKYLFDDEYWQKKSEGLLAYAHRNFSIEAAKNVLFKDISI